MNDTFKKLVVALLVVGALGFLFYQLVSSGKLTFSLNPLPKIENPTQETRTLVKEENAIIDTVENSSPSVVAIGVTQRVINPFDPTALPRNRQSTIGTGFVASDNGVIVTNKHVVSDLQANYTVVTKDGKKLEVEKIYRDPNLDLALVKTKENGLHALKIGDSARLKVGQTVIAIGNALGRFSNTVTTGVVSGLGRSIGAGDPFGRQIEMLDDLIQTDAAINPGNSGGPLLNSAGEVIGVNVAVSESAQNIGFAIPINSVKATIDEFISTGKISRALLGVNYQIVTRDYAILNEIPQGAYIVDVVPGSAAEKAGIESGDIITKIDGKEVNTQNFISEFIRTKKPGDKVSIEVWKDNGDKGETKRVEATLQEANKE
ncbi:trypsin-like peptidase domain-containing protein [Candidatus Daviesbacteria bacterium]|nr:trypsin-like peptidase domain-containing protein [Candidatus Daviesbacteria bacterium]